jgi:DNA-binding transcriptional LysR family regulator
MSKQQKNLNHRLFKVFLAAAETENFTQAAEKMEMTQPGISQQISKLEEQLACALFKRYGKNVKLTDAGEKLVNYISSHFENLDLFYKEIYSEHTKIDGIVRYSMPPSCSLSPHFGILLEDVTKHENLGLDVSISLNNEIIDKVLNGKIDFGFVTEKFSNQSLNYTDFCPEEYILVGSKPRELGAEITENCLHEQNFIDYPGAKIYFNFWLRHYFPDSKFLDYRSLNFTSCINTIQGAITMVENGLGFSVLPRHCVSSLLEKETLFEYNDDSFKTLGPLLNQIYIVEHADYEQPYRVKNVLEWFMNMLH